MTIIPYTAADRDRLEVFLRRQRTFAALNRQTMDAFCEENIADFEADGTASFLVEVDGELLAIVDLLRRHPRDGSLWVGLFVVDERLHGDGTAQTIYEQLERDEMRPYHSMFRLGVLPHNERAYRFWQRQGYTYEKDAVTARGDRVHVLLKTVHP
ncbi:MULTISPECIES: GNAT family N-acetyltransferase [Exiguobacterium]|uniref:GNAT family N-acetyltransferase n=1 Tax=Exiguobacterium TaxID=33986 RepID=UPI0020370208|nr:MULTISPECIES: GNAT family N-acetyltransferase [Exiguobacterium]MCT4783154.1 GNAT family N-acetyltransferase [Exiguobacterium himgiriensis]